jgi:3-isopropylmalate/(R)-2-methylmalate dehydratase large subunit
VSEKRIAIAGRVLFLTRDPALIERQLAGEDLAYDPNLELLDEISTDEIAPAWACYHYDHTLARYVYVGLRGGIVTPDSVRNGGFEVVVSGRSKGCGSSREAAPFAERAAGIRFVFARNIEKIYAQNCQNIGLYASTDFSLLERLMRREQVPVACFQEGLDAISQDVVRAGGLLSYSRARLEGRARAPELRSDRRAMTLAEKIIAAHAVTDAETGAVGVPAVTPGESLFVRTDVRFTHEYVTAMAESLFISGFGVDARVAEPGSAFAFRDHLTMLDRVMPDEHRRLGLMDQARRLADVQQAFATRHGIRLYGEVQRDGVHVGSEGICHTKVLEELALPGQVVVGTDSHTCMAGALGCLAFGIGSTDMASSWLTRDVRLKVPESIRVRLSGRLRPGVCAKDVMLRLLASHQVRTGAVIGRVLEFSGDGLSSLSLDERATLTNMAVEAGAFTGIAPADETVWEYLERQRRCTPGAVVLPDEHATYAASIDIDLGDVQAMVALPGDPRSAIPLSALASTQGDVSIDIAYGGSCTGSKQADMDMYASVAAAALARGEAVPESVAFYVQFGSQRIREYADARGYIDLFQRAGATVLDPSCGACIRAGPGTSTRPNQVTVSAINRNFPGRSGPGQVYLASPLVVAASAFAGKISAPRL